MPKKKLSVSAESVTEGKGKKGDHHRTTFAVGETGASLKIVDNRKIKKIEKEIKKRKPTPLPHSHLTPAALSASAHWGWDSE